jgi:tol-pal system protein YbgF
LTGTALSVAPPPSEVYRLAYSDFSRGMYDLAVVGFTSYLEKYPQGEMAAQAQYYIGESYYAQNNFSKALEEFELVEKNYPQSAVVAASRLKRALCLEQLGKTDEARRLLETLIQDFPNSSEAFTAQEKLKNDQTDGK